MRQGVAHQVADDLPEPDLVADHQQRGTRADGQVDAAVRRDDARVVHRVSGQREQVDWPRLERSLLIEAGEQQHVLDQDAHPRGLLLDSAHDPVEVGRRQLARIGAAGVDAAALAVVLGEPADRGERRPQFVAGVGHELPHLFL